jgi:hypothetical protein
MQPRSGQAISITCAECLCEAFGIQHAVRMRLTVISCQPAGTIFFTLSHKGTIFEKLLGMKFMVWFFLQLLSEIFIIQSTNERDIIKNVYWG